MTFDWLIRGGEVVDGTGAPARRGDVALSGDRIAVVGPDLGGEARHVVEAGGCFVVPGFIDMHAHSDFSLGLCGGPEEAHPGKPHPRQHGCFAKVLGTYVRERGTLGWPGRSTK